MSERTPEQQTAYNHLWRRIQEGRVTRHEVIDDATRLNVRPSIIDAMLIALEVGDRRRHAEPEKGAAA